MRKNSRSIRLCALLVLLGFLSLAAVTSSHFHQSSSLDLADENCVLCILGTQLKAGRGQSPISYSADIVLLAGLNFFIQTADSKTSFLLPLNRAPPRLLS